MNSDLGKAFHPCFNERCMNNIKRIHLPVAEKCNIHCNYCDRGINCKGVNKPGLTSKILKPSEIKSYLKNEKKENCIIGIAGPGEALYNKETFESLEILKDYNTCLCTNGLLLPEKILAISYLKLNYLSITINSLDYLLSTKIYNHVFYNNNKYLGLEATKLLLEKQKLGLKMASRMGFNIKINTVYIPGVNDNQILPIAKLANFYGVQIMNIIPIIPSGDFTDIKIDIHKLKSLREQASKYILQKSFCGRCRADAYGFINKGDVKFG